MENPDLTERQEEVLKRAIIYFNKNDNFPTQRKLGQIIGIYQNSIRDTLLRLEKKGWIEKNEDGKYRRTVKYLAFYCSNHPQINATRSKFQSPRKAGPKGLRDEREDSVH